MKQLLLKAAVGLIVLMVLAAGVMLLRNYQMEAGVRALKNGDGVTAMDKFMPLAKLGDHQAQFLLGSIYAYGWGGIPKSDMDAIYWLRRAAMFAEEGSDPATPAELGIAKSYSEGTDGVKIDATESAKWLRLAAEGGSKEAAAMLKTISDRPQIVSPSLNPTNKK